jgi:hypothetical protein
MRFLKTLTLNRRAIYDDRLAINTASEVVMNTPTNLLLPKGNTAALPVSPVDGMIRYNSQTGQFQGRQAGAWRDFRFKESTNIVFQTNLAVGDDVETDFGPLSPDPFVYSSESGVTWDAAQIAQNILVINETIWQVPGAGKDYIIVQKPTGPAGANETYIRFTIPIATGRPVYVVHNIGQ